MKNLRHGELARVGPGRRVVAAGTGVSGLLMVLSIALILGSPMGFAQQGNGTVSGTVRDASGAVVPGASVVLRNEASGTELKTTSDGSGLYVINYVPVATYTLRVSIKGFKESVQSGIHVAPDAALQEDATLQVGTQVETIEVKSTAVNLITKSSGGMAPTIGATQIQNTSTAGRDAMELLTLLPGVVGGTGIPGAPGSGFADFSNGSGFQTSGAGINNFNINGLRSDQNMVKLDNSDIIDPGNNGGFTVEPNMDMIQEFSVKQSGFEASQGNAGVIVDAVTKSGGSKVRGEAYWYARNAVFNANDWSNNLAGVPKPNSKFNYPGFNIGGPVRIPGTSFNKNNDKMFFFYALEIQRQLTDPGTQLKVMPTAAMRNGDFSGLLSMVDPKTNKTFCSERSSVLNMPCIVNDIATGKPAPGNILPPSEVTADGQDLLNHTYLLPNPIYNDPTGNTNYAFHSNYPTNRIENTIRVDYNLTQNTRAFLRIAQNSDTEYYPYGLWWGSGIPRITPDTGHLSGEAASLNVVQVINPTLTNEVQFSANANNFPWKAQDPSKVSSAQLRKDLPGFNWAQGSGGSVFTRTMAVPTIWDGVDSTGSDNWTGSQDTLNGVFGDKTTFELTDNLTKVKGTHSLQFGANILHTRNDQNSSGVQGRIWSTNWGDGGTTGNLFGDLLAQGFTNYDQTTNDVDGMWRFWNYEWYAQDSWKVSRKLTINYGSRFAYFPPWYEARGKVANFNPNLWTAANDTSINDGVQVGSGIKAAEAEPFFPQSLLGKFAGGAPSSGGFPNPPMVIEPRLAFAYDVFGTGKTVLRVGAGVYQERDQGNTVFGAAQNPPFTFDANNNFATNITQAGGGFATIANFNPTAGGIAATAFDTTDKKGAESYSWNFTVDQDIGHQTVVEAAYVGDVGRHLYIENILGPIGLGAMWCNNPANATVCGADAGLQVPVPGANNTGTQNSYRYYKPFGAIDLLHHVSASNYHSLQVTMRRNVTHGLTLLTSYTYSKTLGYNSAFNGVVDPFNSRLNYGLQSYDRPQNLNISYIYQLPNMGAKHFSGNRFAGGVLDNWQISGITNYQSGQPLTIGNGTLTCKQATPITGTDLCNAGGNTPQYFQGTYTWYGTDARTLAPLLLSNPQSQAGFKGVGSNWLNPASVTLPPIGNPGTREQPQFLGPASNNWDLTLFKSFSLGEQRRLEFRAAAFDIFNRAQLDTPGSFGATAELNPNFTVNVPADAKDFSHATFSPVTNVPGAGQACGSGNFGCISNKHGHREMEFALKLYF